MMRVYCHFFSLLAPSAGHVYTKTNPHSFSMYAVSMNFLPFAATV